MTQKEKLDNDNTTIWVQKITRDKLRKAQQYPNEAFDSIITRLLKKHKES